MAGRAREKFGLEFDILTRDMIENSRSGNPFSDHNRLIARLDVLARNEELQDKLAQAAEWDLIICDEAHRMSATYFAVRRNTPKDTASVRSSVRRVVICC